MPNNFISQKGQGLPVSGKDVTTVCTYNVHKFRGLDRRFSPERTFKILSKINSPLFVLQEAVSYKKGPFTNLIFQLAHRMGLNAVFVPTFETENYYFGNAVLTSHPIEGYNIHHVGLPGKEPRNIIEALLKVNGRPTRLLCTHLGLTPKERTLQFGEMVNLAGTNEKDPLIALGDFNEISFKSSICQKIKEIFPLHLQRPTFPSFSPFLSLDQIWIRPPGQILDLFHIKTFTSILASDHLPLVAQLQLGE